MPVRFAFSRLAKIINASVKSTPDRLAPRKLPLDRSVCAACAAERLAFSKEAPRNRPCLMSARTSRAPAKLELSQQKEDGKSGRKTASVRYACDMSAKRQITSFI